MKNKFITIFVFMMMTLTLLVGLFETTKAYVDGDWYVCDFEDFAVGTMNFSVYDEGEKWLDVTAEADSEWEIYDNAGDRYYYSQYLDSTAEYCYFNVSGYWTDVSVRLKSKVENEGHCFNHIYAWTEDGDMIFHFYHYYSNGYKYRVYDHDGTWIGETATSDTRTWWFNFSYIDSNGTMYTSLEIAEAYEGYLDTGYEDYIKYISFLSGAHISAYESYMNIYDFRVKNGLVSYPWEDDYPDNVNVGDVTIDYEVSYATTLTQNYELLEQRHVVNTNSSFQIEQVAWQIDYTSTDIDDLVIRLYVNGQNFGTYDNYYTSIEDCYILIWKDLNKTVGTGGEDINLEFYIIDDDGTHSFGWHTIIDDVDDDGFMEYKRSVGDDAQSHRDGIYNGVINSNEDLIYQMWFNITTDEWDNDTQPTEGDFYFAFYNIEEPVLEDGLLHYKGNNIAESTMGSLNYCEMLIYNSNLTPSGMINSYSTTGKIGITATFVEGDYYTFNFMNSGNQPFNCRIDGEIRKFSPKTKTYRLYTGKTYNIFLYPVNYIDGVDYPYNGGWKYYNDGSIKLYLTNRNYDFGETLRMRYILPSLHRLEDDGFPTGGWWIGIYNMDDYGFLGYRDKWNYVIRKLLEPEDFGDSDWSTWEFSLTEGNGFEDTYQKYEIVITTGEAGWPFQHEILREKYFWCTGIDFVPEGEITSITPNPCNLSDTVTISWTANGRGDIQICYPNGDYYTGVPYGYSDATHETDFHIGTTGKLIVKLYVDSPLAGTEGRELVDTDYLWCNTTSGFEEWGYGVPYCWIPQNRLIAGNSTLYIHYRTYKNNSILWVYSPRQETTWFSTTVSNQSAYTYNFVLPEYMQIGLWNVSFECGDIYGNNITLNTSFSVITEEGNWIEFTKNVYNTTEEFGLIVKHKYRIALTFYKNDVAQGESLVFEDHALDNEIFRIPHNVLKPEVGDWRVEMWRINDRNRVYELAEWECKVVAGKFPTYQGAGGVLPVVLPPLSYILGMIISMFCIMIPFVVNKGIKSQKGVPPITYAMTGSLGLIVCVLLGFFPAWTISFIVITGIIVTVFFWVKNKKGEAEGE